MTLNFTGANWVYFFLQGPKSKFGNFTGTKSTFYPTKNIHIFYNSKDSKLNTITKNLKGRSSNFDIFNYAP
jgi:hypothetical protein